MLAWWRGRGRRARPRGSPWGPGRGLPASPAVWQSARCFRGHSGRASALRPPLLPPAPGPGLPRPAPRAPLPAALSASRCDCRMPSASALVVAVLCLQLACALPGGDGRSYGCGRRGRGGLPDPGGHRAQRPRGKGLSLGTGTRPPWGPHHAWGWQWPQEGLLEGQVLPTGSGPCLCPSLGEGVEGCGAVSLGWGPLHWGVGQPRPARPAAAATRGGRSHEEREDSGNVPRAPASPLDGRSVAPWHLGQACLEGGWCPGGTRLSTSGRGGCQPAVPWTHLSRRTGEPQRACPVGSRPGPQCPCGLTHTGNPRAACSVDAGAVSRRLGLRAVV